MRQYRGKKTDTGEWLYGYLHVYSNGQTFINIDENGWEVDPATVCQSTGLRDKNGKEIWEGDIVRYMDGKNMEVFYSTNGYASWKLKRKPNHGKGLLVYDLYNHKGGSGAEEIIGNIHDKEENNEPTN